MKAKGKCFSNSNYKIYSKYCHLHIKYPCSSIRVEWFDISTLYLYLIYYNIYHGFNERWQYGSKWRHLWCFYSNSNSNPVIYKWKSRDAITVMTSEIVVYNIFGEISGLSMLTKCITLTGWRAHTPVNCMFFCYHPIKNNSSFKKSLRI